MHEHLARFTAARGRVLFIGRAQEKNMVFLSTVPDREAPRSRWLGVPVNRADDFGGEPVLSALRR